MEKSLYSYRFRIRQLRFINEISSSVYQKILFLESVNKTLTSIVKDQHLTTGSYNLIQASLSSHYRRICSKTFPNPGCVLSNAKTVFHSLNLHRHYRNLSSHEDNIKTFSVKNTLYHHRFSFFVIKARKEAK